MNMPKNMSEAYRVVTQLKDANKKKDKRIEELERIVECVAHIGVDFGYGQYSIDQKTIEKSRELTTKGGAN
jgi:hypothetical protein